MTKALSKNLFTLTVAEEPGSTTQTQHLAKNMVWEREVRKGKHLKKYLIHRETDVVLTVEKTKNCSGGKVNT